MKACDRHQKSQWVTCLKKFKQEEAMPWDANTQVPN